MSERRILFVIATLIIAGVLYWSLRVYTPGIRDDPTAPTRAISSLEAVTMDSDRQWILIRGRNRHAPIVLFLHGGPGMPLMYLAYAFQPPLENDFVVVQWDRRGAGKSYHPGIDPAKMRLSREIADTIMLIDNLRARFGSQKIILVGHSYGTTLGLLVAERRPDLIRAYVGVGQEACDRATELNLQDRWIAEEGRLRGDAKAVAVATSGKSYDREPWLFKYGGEIVDATSFLHLIAIGLRAPEYSLVDALHVKTGVDFTHADFKNDVFSGPLMDAVPSLDVPAYFFEGRYDYTSPFTCAKKFFDRLRAPHKELVWFNRAAHFPFLEEPRQFRDALRRVAAETAGKP